MSSSSRTPEIIHPQMFSWRFLVKQNLNANCYCPYTIQHHWQQFGNVCQPVQVVEEICLWTIWQKKHSTQQRQQVESLKPGVTVSGLATREGVVWFWPLGTISVASARIRTRTWHRLGRALLDFLQSSDGLPELPWGQPKVLELLPSKPPHTLNKISPAGQSWSDFWCFWWCSLPLQSGHWFSACTLNKMAREASKRYVWSYIEEISQIVFRRNVWAYWKKLYFASMSNLSMLNWSTFRPLVLCWKEAKVLILVYNINSKLLECRLLK